MRIGPAVMGIAIGSLSAGLLFALTQCSTLREQSDDAGPPTRYGSYLAGRHAANARDAEAAALFFEKAVKFDPGNPELLERAVVSEVAQGDLDGAATHAERLMGRISTARLPRLVTGVQAMRDGGYAKSRQEFEKVTGNAAAEIAARLGAAYATFAEGNFDGAKAVIDKMAANEGVRAFGQYHLAVIEDLAGRAKDALGHFEEANRLSGGESLRILHAYASHLGRMGQTQKARAVYDAFLKKAPSNPVARAALAQLGSGAVPPRVIAGVKEGVAEAFYGIGSSLSDERAVEIPVFYLQLALALDPNHELALSLLADRLELAERLEDAIAAYERIAPTSPLYLNARQQIAQNLTKMKQPDRAIAILKAALRGQADDVEIHASIGDVLRGKENYADAAAAYTLAIGRIALPEERHWTLFYARGISYERSGRWAEAERDLKVALKLKPEQALVMNYLAYTWVEQGVNIPAALAMLKRAVDLRPEDGFVIDSLGWAYYRMGDYRSAIAHLEKAILIEPGEATINDHLGDAYWHVGRQREAKYQWQRAMTLKPEPGDEAKIRRKIETGLAKAPPVSVQAGTPPASQ